jgi:hypothetical protein
LRPDFWRTFRPGAAEVPAADADMLRTTTYTGLELIPAQTRLAPIPA